MARINNAEMMSKMRLAVSTGINRQMERFMQDPIRRFRQEQLREQFGDEFTPNVKKFPDASFNTKIKAWESLNSIDWKFREITSCNEHPSQGEVKYNGKIWTPSSPFIVDKELLRYREFAEYFNSAAKTTRESGLPMTDEDFKGVWFRQMMPFFSLSMAMSGYLLNIDENIQLIEIWNKLNRYSKNLVEALMLSRLQAETFGPDHYKYKIAFTPKLVSTRFCTGVGIRFTEIE